MSCFVKRLTYPLFGLVLALSSSSASGFGERIVFIAGGPSHDYGSHEHYAGSRILADAIKRTVPDIEVDILQNGWPNDDSILDGAATIVIYSDGGGGHPSLPHLDRLGKLMDQGVGLVCLHYAVEVPKGEAGDRFLDWLGGYFELHWSVNPHWTAEITSLPEHPISEGVSPFKSNDEWYFHMRFRPEMEGVTPILTALPPESTMDRPDGPHSGNPHVRKAMAERIPQHIAWAYERKNGGRSFGYTGGHVHWNWGRPEVARLVSNAILWTAKVDVPPGGAKTQPLGVSALQANQDEPPPEAFNPDHIRQAFMLPDGQVFKATPLKLFQSSTVTSATPNHRVQVSADIEGVKRLFLVVTDGGDGFGCDWANWLQPTLSGPSGSLRLIDLNWKSARTQWGSVRKNRNANGDRMSVQGKPVSNGIGTHANSVVEFELPEGYTKFTAIGALDTGGTSQADGKATSVQFAVYADAAPLVFEDDVSDLRNPENAVAGLSLGNGLQVQLSASEPTLKSLTNLDIDHRGRVWVCEVVNYRKHNGERPEGDRILILEDIDGDGIMDASKVYYQGRDIDSAMGICVLGNKVIVSASPNIWVFTDENGDDIPEKKELMFSNTGIPQHDHSAHSFMFGPDGKLYWNFGNTGHAVHDKDGNIVKDRWGREVRETGKPYRQGMVFRCNLDGSDFEVLGYNFRNNYEVTVDSFGSLWQSDNDDDGNKAVRINYVMEFGNYGYQDEMTGAGWQVERPAWEAEIPQRHWHLNDPGVVPTLLITGAGSPTGIMVYEGKLLPEVFHGQVIHCDAGPNVVRSYITKPRGAGYEATIENLIVGEKDRWFRPADVCVAPDGSLFVTDWYDPGVGGHNMEDMERGRLFRISVPEARYQVPKFDFGSLQGAIEAFKNPCLSVRYLAWQSLMNRGRESLPALEALTNGDDARLRARAYWLLGKIDASSKYALQAMNDADPNVRVAGIRLARQLRLPTKEFIPVLISDSDMSVLRELAIALHEDTSDEMPKFWVQLANRYDGNDRWYLEALGIGAAHRWDECLSQFLDQFGGRPLPSAAKNIVWRSRASISANWIVKLLKEEGISEERTSQLLRSLDFLGEKEKQKALESLLDSDSE